MEWSRFLALGTALFIACLLLVDSSGKFFEKTKKINFYKKFKNIFVKVEALCSLPNEWSGKWYQSKYTELMSINRTSFIGRGECIENRLDKFIFYEKYLINFVIF